MCANHDHGNTGLPAGTLRVIVLPDSRIRIETGDMSGATHASAAAAIPALARVLGVTIEESTRIVRGLVHEHEHAHVHGGIKAGGGHAH